MAIDPNVIQGGANTEVSQPDQNEKNVEVLLLGFLRALALEQAGEIPEITKENA